MLFAIICHDGPRAPGLRPQWYAQHKAYVAQAAERIAFAGPFLTEAGGAPKGSMLVMEFAGRQAVDAWLKEEPFNSHGVYASVQVEIFANYWPQKVGFPPPQATPAAQAVP
jgi:uncharacterized protein YciI